MRCFSISVGLMMVVHFLGSSVFGINSHVSPPAILGFMNCWWMLKHFLLYSAILKWRISFCFALSLFCCAASRSSWRYASRRCAASHFISLMVCCAFRRLLDIDPEVAGGVVILAFIVLSAIEKSRCVHSWLKLTVQNLWMRTAWCSAGDQGE